MNSALIYGICDIDCGSTTLTVQISRTDFRCLSFDDIDVFITTWMFFLVNE